jgi:hypothetical protein
MALSLLRAARDKARLVVGDEHDALIERLEKVKGYPKMTTRIFGVRSFSLRTRRAVKASRTEGSR